MKIGPQGHIYLPKKLRENFESSELKIIPDKHAAVLYPADTKPQIILTSLQLIIQDLKMQIETKQEAA